MPHNRHFQQRTTARHYIAITGFILAGMLITAAILLLIGAQPPRSGIFAFSVFPQGQVSNQASSTCTTPQHTAGTSALSLTSNGIVRTFRVHLATSYGDQPQALVISYSGYNMRSQDMENLSNMDATSNKNGFVVVYPQALDNPPSWDAGVGAYGPTGDADDIQFTRDLLKYLKTNYCIDSHRVYLTGFSLGGGMTYRAACALSDQITAIATVSGAYYPFPETCAPSHPLPVLEIHGAADTQAPYTGNPPLLMAAVHDYLNGWLAIDQCQQTSDVFFQQGDATATEWTHCAAGVVIQHYRISDGPHQWFKTPTYSIDSSTVVWQFFDRFTYTIPTPTPAPKSPTAKK